MNDNPVQILGPEGRPLRPTRAQMLAGDSGGVAYDAADMRGEHMAAWRPHLWSADGELNPYRDRIVSRMRDAVRNDGWASGTVTRILDNAIGAKFRPISKPDYRALAAYTGNKAFDATWADEFGRAAEANYRGWANDPSRWSDTQRKNSIPQIMRLAFRHKIVDGDALAMLHWLPERLGRGRARYATAVQVIDPDRLSNPQLRFDVLNIRGGVEIDEFGAAVAYHIRRAHQGDWFNAAKAQSWERIQRETAWGRPIIVHDFDSDRADQHRGGAGVLTPVLQRLKMLIKYDGTELDAAIINAIFGAYIESPFDREMVEESVAGGESLGKFQDMRAEFHDGRRFMLNGVRMPILFPGEKINAVTAERPSSNFEPFEAAVLRNVAAGTGMAPQQVSNNYSDANYSSLRAALLEAWKTLSRRRNDFSSGFGDPIWGAHLEEQFDVDELPLPAGAPEFLECRAAYARCVWMGPGRGWIDPVDEKQGSVLGLDAGLSTLEIECAENVGEDWEEIADQRKLEIEAYRKRGLPIPSWAGMQPAGKVSAGRGGATATEVSQPPEPPKAASSAQPVVQSAMPIDLRIKLEQPAPAAAAPAPQVFHIHAPITIPAMPAPNFKFEMPVSLTAHVEPGRATNKTVVSERIGDTIVSKVTEAS